MKAVLFRTGSVPLLPSLLSCSPRISLSLSVHDSFSGEKNHASSPKIALNLDINRRRCIIRRTLSESDVIRSENESSGASSKLSSIGIGSGSQVEELEFAGGGVGKKRKFGDGNKGGTEGGNAYQSKIVDYYEKMLKLNPTNSLLLSNYAQYLHEVEKDMVKAEEYYGRAILASPGDGEVLSLYGKLIWETERDEDRAKSYFDRAVHASPDDCMVMGSYAHFMWEADEDEEDGGMEKKLELTATMAEAF